VVATKAATGRTGSRATKAEAEDNQSGRVPTDAEWQAHPTVNTTKHCPWCGIPALHEQHCKQICLACGWYQSCVD
jgi:hypothetical protein